ELGGISQDQESPRSTGGPRLVPVGRRDRLEGDLLGVEEAVGGLGVAPGLHLSGGTLGGGAGDLGRDGDQSAGAFDVAQGGGGEVGLGPGTRVEGEGIHGGGTPVPAPGGSPPETATSAGRGSRLSG